MKHVIILLVGAFAIAAHGGQFPDGQQDTFGPLYQPRPIPPPESSRRPDVGMDTLRRWNRLAIDASGLDHTPVAAGETRRFGEQFGPCRASRAMAIVHVAMFDAVNAAVGDYSSYTGLPKAREATSLDAAIAQSAHDTLAALFPSQAPAFDVLLAQDLAALRNNRNKTDGIDLGKRAAAAILALRANDGSQYAEMRVGDNYLTSDLPGYWRQDPISRIPLALGAQWGIVRPFVMLATNQFRLPPPPPMDSLEYTLAFNEVKDFGGDGVVTPTVRNDDQTQIGIYWAYDGTPTLCAPPRLYNQIATTIADLMGTDSMQLARLLALINVAMADSGIAAWESKYFYNVWRPVTGIREADPGTGPTGAGDGNPATVSDPTYVPLCAPASNLAGPNFTPPFPAYPSGHATFGGALFQVLRRFYGTDDIEFTFVSDEFNGVTVDNTGAVRPLLPRHFTSLSQAEEENGQSRIYLGIHWAFDKTGGIAQGRAIADYVFDHVLVPVKKNHEPKASTLEP